MSRRSDGRFGPGPLRTLAARFHEKVDSSAGVDACWPFVGALDGHGYGSIWAHGRVSKAHRVALELANGEPPDPRREVMHTCDNPRCCNPRHLVVATHAENMADMGSKGRSHAPRMSGMDHPLRKNPELAARGSRVGGAKLSEADIPAILEARASGEHLSAIGRRFGVSESLISLVVKRRIWRHV
jgi:hypothetical protein